MTRPYLPDWLVNNFFEVGQKQKYYLKWLHKFTNNVSN